MFSEDETVEHPALQKTYIYEMLIYLESNGSEIFWLILVSVVTLKYSP